MAIALHHRKAIIIRALLVRIGIDQTFGKWNAPVAKDGHFVFVPIPESLGTEFHPGLNHEYSEVLPALKQFCTEHHLENDKRLSLPKSLLEQSMHLDPDFARLTYGDEGARRGSKMKNLKDGDLLVFYASLYPVYPCQHKLLYALIGLYVVQEVVLASDILESRWFENAHVRKVKRSPTDIVVRAKPGCSGRLDRCIAIGEFRDRAYRVEREVLDSWGGLSVKDGYIQLSGVPPEFSNPRQFLKWFEKQAVQLIPRNN